MSILGSALFYQDCSSFFVLIPIDTCYYCSFSTYLWSSFFHPCVVVYSSVGAPSSPALCLRAVLLLLLDTRAPCCTLLLSSSSSSSPPPAAVLRAGVPTKPSSRSVWIPLLHFFRTFFAFFQIGISRAACAEDELMLASVAASAPARILPIVDCRPRSSATANFATGSSSWLF